MVCVVDAGLFLNMFLFFSRHRAQQAAIAVMSQRVSLFWTVFSHHNDHIEWTDVGVPLMPKEFWR